MRAELYLKATALEAGIVVAWEEGVDPVEFMLPVARAQVKAALEGDGAAAGYVVDSVYGKMKQDVVGEERVGLVDMALLGAARELLIRLPAARTPERVERVIEHEQELDVSGVGGE